VATNHWEAAVLDLGAVILVHDIVQEILHVHRIERLVVWQWQVKVRIHPNPKIGENSYAV
jgi:hypothetical protein